MGLVITGVSASASTCRLAQSGSTTVFPFTMISSTAVPASSSSASATRVSFKMQFQPPIWKRYASGLVIALGLPLLTALAYAVSPLANPSTPGIASLGQLPLFFEAQQGSSTESSRFVAHCPGGLFSISSTGSSITLNDPGHFPNSKPQQLVARTANRKVQPRNITMQFLGANSHAVMHGESLASGKANYFIGADPSSWRTGQPLFKQIRVEQI